MSTTPGDSGGVGPVEPGKGERNPADSEMKLVATETEAAVPDVVPDPARPGVDVLSPDEESELARLQAKAAKQSAGAGAMLMKVEPPHSEVTFGGVTVGTDFTLVPAHMAANVASAAAEAGVKITQKDEES